MSYEVRILHAGERAADGVNYTYDVKANFRDHWDGGGGPAETLEEAIRRVKRSLKRYQEDERYEDLPNPTHENVEFQESEIFEDKQVEDVKIHRILPTRNLGDFK